MKNEKMQVAVYGTLMEGERNHHWAFEAGAKKVADGMVWGMLYDTGFGYPIFIPRPRKSCLGYWVAVEVLEVDAEGIAHMDKLEGYPNLYIRTQVLVDFGPEADKEFAIIYMPNPKRPLMATAKIKPNSTPKWAQGARVADWRVWRRLGEEAALDEK